MKFDDQYPDAQPGIPPRPNIVMSMGDNQERPCNVCGDATRWFHREPRFDDCIDWFWTELTCDQNGLVSNNRGRGEVNANSLCRRMNSRS